MISFALLDLPQGHGKLTGRVVLPRVHIGLFFVILPLSHGSLTIFNPMRTQLLFMLCQMFYKGQVLFFGMDCIDQSGAGVIQCVSKKCK